MTDRSPRKQNAPHKAGRKEKLTHLHCADLSADAQRRRLLDALRCNSISTLETRHNLDILHPAMRVRELRLDGYAIQTVRVGADTGFGVNHSVARYVHMAEPHAGNHGA